MEEQSQEHALETSEQEEHYPLLIKRIQSIFIDVLILLGATAVISTIINQIGDVQDWVRAAMFIVLWFLYEPIAMTLGCTIGNYLRRIRVRKAEDESKRINLFQAFVRFFIKGMLGWVSFFTIHANTQKRAIHDLISGSVMIEI